ncbi:MAG: hypothetical protein AB7I98_03940 [Verrucomicrobiales bacterium]
METLLHGSLTSEKVSASVGGGNFVWPSLSVEDTIKVRLRFTHRIDDGETLKRGVNVQNVFAGVGLVDVRPSEGALKLKIGNGAVGETNVTADIDFDAEASEWAAAINALAVVGEGGTYGAASVRSDNGSMIVVFAGEVAAVPITVQESTLAPKSLVRIYAQLNEGKIEHEIRLIVAPWEFTETFWREEPKPPFIERVEAGNDETGLNEVQRLVIPSEFEASYRIFRAGVPSGVLIPADDADGIAAALVRLADEGGEFSVTETDADTARIEFGGTMAATPQDLLTVQVYDAPEGDLTFMLNLDRWSVYQALRASDNVAAVIQIRVAYLDDQGEPQVWSHIGGVTIQRGLIWAGMAAGSDVDWLRFVANRTFLYRNPGSVVTGYQSVTRTIGGGTGIYEITHDLNARNLIYTAATNPTPGTKLVEGRDFEIDDETLGGFRLTLKEGGLFTNLDPEDEENDIPAEGGIVLTFLAPLDRSALANHGHTMAQIEGLVEAFAAALARIEALETAQGGGNLISRDPAAPLIVRTLPTVWRVLRSRVLPSRPSSLAAFDASSLRDAALLPALHDAATEALPLPLPEPGGDNKGKVFLAGEAVEDFPDGGLRAGDFAACTDGEWFRVAKSASGESSYYPVAYEVELFREFISADELALKSALTLRFGFEAMMASPKRRPRDRESLAVHWYLFVAVGSIVRDASPGTPGSNLDSVTWADPVIETRIEVTPIPKASRFGIEIQRSGAGVLSLKTTVLRNTTGGVAPASANFALRGWLGRFDVDDKALDPRGLVLLRGLDVGLDGETDASLGKIIIS